MGAQQRPRGRRLGWRRYREPVELVDRLVAAGGAGELGGVDGPDGQGPNRRDRPSRDVGQLHRPAGGRAEQPDAKCRAAGAVQRRPRPGEWQRHPPTVRARFGGVHERRVQRGVQQRGMNPVPLAVHTFGESHLGVDVVTVEPRGAQPLEGRTVAEPGFGEVPVEAVHGDGDGTGRRPHAGRDGRRRGTRTESAGGVLGPGQALARVGDAGADDDRPAARPVGRPGEHLQSIAPCSVKTRGACRVRSSTCPPPVCAQACRASSTKAVPGNSTVSRTAWSGSHGWLSIQRRPVYSRPPSGSSAVAPSSGCSAGLRPTAVTSPPLTGAGSQYGWCWNAYVGRSIRCAPGKTWSSPPSARACGRTPGR